VCSSDLDLEMSFVGENDIYQIVEEMVTRIFAEAAGINLTTPFPRISYDDAMNLYGSDKPDLRFDCPIHTLDDIAADSGFGVFAKALSEGGTVRCLNATALASWSRKQVDQLEEVAKKKGAFGLARAKVVDGKLDTGIAKFLSDEFQQQLIERTGCQDGDLILFVAGEWTMTVEALGAVRLAAASAAGWIPEGTWALAWVRNFPLFEKNNDGGWTACHHMFTQPRPEDLAGLDDDPGAARAQLYDLVCNGVELGSGSIRIHQRDLQEKIFKISGISDHWLDLGADSLVPRHRDKGLADRGSRHA